MDVVAELDLSAFHARYRADGRGGAAYDPRLMLAVLIYAYALGERSSRRIERRLMEDVAFRVGAVNQQTDHATTARFRVQHEDAIAQLFGQVLAVCARAGVLRPGLVAIDGTKLTGNASGNANRSASNSPSRSSRRPRRPTRPRKPPRRRPRRALGAAGVVRRPPSVPEQAGVPGCASCSRSCRPSHGEVLRGAHREGG